MKYVLILLVSVITVTGSCKGQSSVTSPPYMFLDSTEVAVKGQFPQAAILVLVQESVVGGITSTPDTLLHYRIQQQTWIGEPLVAVVFQLRSRIVIEITYVFPDTSVGKLYTQLGPIVNWEPSPGGVQVGYWSNWKVRLACGGKNCSLKFQKHLVDPK